MASAVTAGAPTLASAPFDSLATMTSGLIVADINFKDESAAKRHWVAFFSQLGRLI